MKSVSRHALGLGLAVVLLAGCEHASKPSVQAPASTTPPRAATAIPAGPTTAAEPAPSAQPSGEPPQPAPAAAATTPAASNALPFAIDALRFRVAHDKLVAVAGELHTVVPSVYRATSVIASRPEADGNSVRVTYGDEHACEGPDARYDVSLSLAPLAARMLNTRALDAHHAHRYEEAAQGFSVALARTNLACALNQGGRPSEALAALQPLIASNPVLAYSKVVTDPELQGLASAPEIVALKATPRASTVRIDRMQGALVGAGGRAVAQLVSEPSWGTEQSKLTLVVFAAADGRELLRTLLVDWGDTEEEGGGLRPSRRAAVQQRIDEVSGWLTDLGFAPDPHAQRLDARKLGAGAALAGTGLRVQLRRDGAGIAVLARGRQVALAPVSGRESTLASYLPSVNALAL